MNQNEQHTKDIPEETFQVFLNEHPNGATLEQIAQVMGLTRERVAQIVNKSLVKLRTACERRGVSVDDCPHTETQWEKMG